jgi:two-component system sensor histidine kinase PilS (NtrC family)
VTAPTPAGIERRRRDRRLSDRRDDDAAFSATLTDESLFGAIGDPMPAEAPEPEPSRGAAPSRGASGWSDSAQPADSRFLSRQARRIVSEGGSTFQRLFRTFVGARAVLGLALLATQVTGAAFGSRTPLALVISTVYAVQAITMWLLPRFRPSAGSRLSRAQWLATIGVDLLAFSALHTLQPETTFNYVPLLVLPALMAGVLTSRVPAVATAAAASLMLLATAWRGTPGGIDATNALTPAALMGIGLFAIALLAGELAARLAREEAAARGSLALARQQAQLNRLVIEEMADGVLVVDRRGRVRAANPAARRLLAAQGLCRAAPFQLEDEPAWAELQALAMRAFESPSWTDVARDVQLKFPAGPARSLRARVRFTRARPPRDGEAVDRSGASPEVFCVLFIEDLRTVQERTRQEKLAAMGRVSAGIAHEIRNPLAAIAQANALLGEGATDGEQKMLTAMVADNVERLKRIVDDVMEVAPRPEAEPQPIDLGAEVGRIVADWARTSGVETGPGSRLAVTLPHEPLSVVFDADHLRRVLVNLLDNARRYASDAPGAITLVVERRAAQARLSVASDGDPIPDDLEPFLFEPFFSTRSRGTGLGLYICRELCERYGGSIEYWQHPPGAAHRNEFVVAMRVAVPAPRVDAQRFVS